jgi:hypothetical protein
MKLPLPARSRGVEAPLDRIADAMRDAASARVSIREVVAETGCAHDLEGVWDFRKHRGRIGGVVDDAAMDLLYMGPDVFSRLSPEEEERTGKVWKWLEERQEHWASEHAETVASVRHFARPVNAAVEEYGDERVHRYSLLIRSRPDTGDPLLEAVHGRVRELGVKRLTIDVWMTADGRLRATRHHAVIYRSYRWRNGMAEMFLDHWDYGVELDELPVPSPGQVLWPESEPPRPGLKVLIDGVESGY